MNRVLDTVVRDMLKGMALGHQAGQWSERRWWGHRLPGEDVAQQSIDPRMISEHLHVLLTEPPFVSTPGWGPTCFVDHVPFVTELCDAFARQDAPLSPEQFRDWILAARDWILPQGVGRSCIELMAEGMNPRITGLFAASVTSGCWVAWPAGLYNAGNIDDAYEDAVKLARSMNGGDIVELTGALSAALSQAAVPDSKWVDIKAALLHKIARRNKQAHAQLLAALEAGANAPTKEALFAIMRSPAYIAENSIHNVDWMPSFYSAVASVEFAFKNSLDWPDLLCLALECGDTRFGPMLMCSLYAAVNGCEWDSTWQDGLRPVHAPALEATATTMTAAIHNRVDRAIALAEEVAPLAGDDSVPVVESRLYDRILAAMLAGTAANVMGSPVEDLDYDQIVARHGVVTEILDAKRIETEDDAAMAILWNEAILRAGGRIYPEDLGDIFLEKLNPKNFYYDTGVAYRLLEKGLPAHACGHWNVVTGSALMGCNGVGMYHVADPRTAGIDGLELSYHYQRGFDVHAAAILCAATAEALRANATIDSVIEAAIMAAPAEPQPSFNRTQDRDARAYFRSVLRAVAGETDVLAVRKTLYDNFLEYNGQDPWEVIAFTLAIFKVANGDIWQCMIGGTNIGRDSDTIACQTTLLTACLKGMAEVPDYVMTLYTEKSLVQYRALAAGLVQLVREKCAAAHALSTALFS